ncbi:hypothetical protein TWF506_002510 [Arthrobotrys conoides]|uniref:THIF-type NAD/FAD binding fold domain-containing protein n=1 Tax=Arthrobotrys conoides TaxID=74498 RepID=A0AAN8P943_9PEZI
MSFDYSSLPPSYYSTTTSLATTPSAPHKSSKTRSKDRDRTIDPEGASSVSSSKDRKHHKSSSSKHKSSSKDKDSSSSRSKDKDKDKDKKKKSKHHKKDKEKDRKDPSSSESEADDMSNSFSMQSVGSSLSSLATSHRAQLAATALVSGLVVGGTILGYQNSKRRIRTQMLKESLSHLSDEEGDEAMERSVDLSHFLAHSTTPSSTFNSSTSHPPPYTLSPTSNTTTSTAIPRNSEHQSTSRPITDAESTVLAKRAQSLAAKNKPIPEELILEQLSRNHSFLGTQGLRTIRSSFVVIVGLGGVGSWCATMLVRSGIGRVRLIDFDQVTLSSLNRHAVATLEDVGTPKVLAMKKRLEAVAPWVEIEACVELWTEKDAKRLLDGEPDWVIDAIDNIDTKVDLLAYCHGQGIPVISSMGAGCKSDPTRILIGDISETTEDPLSKSTRRKLRQRGIPTGITVVYSTEKPGPGKAQLLPLAEDEHTKGSVSELGVLENFRVRILPVLGTMPATFGLAAANHVLCKLAEYPLEYLPGQTRFRPQFYGQVVNQLVAVESRIRNNLPGLKVPVSEADAGYIVEEIFGGKSVISGLGNRLQLVRWYSPIGSRFDDGTTGETTNGEVNEKEIKNRMQKVGVGVDGAIFLKLSDLVVMTKEEVKIHEKRVLVGGESPVTVWGQEVQDLVEKKWKQERAFSQWRD